MTVSSPRKDVFELFQRYWRAYGGCKQIATSPYSWFSFVFSVLLFPLWLREDGIFDIAINVLPSLLGFTLGGYAMFLAFGDREFLKILTRVQNEGLSAYRSINSTFVHFIVIQVSGLLWALLIKAYPILLDVWFLKITIVLIGAFLFIYALVLALAVTLNLFRFTTWYERALSEPEKEGKDPKQS